MRILDSVLDSAPAIQKLLIRPHGRMVIRDFAADHAESLAKLMACGDPCSADSTETGTTT
jgi:hypothetical protein